MRNDVSAGLSSSGYVSGTPIGRTIAQIRRIRRNSSEANDFEERVFSVDAGGRARSCGEKFVRGFDKLIL